jgi:hypothetical protein
MKTAIGAVLVSAVILLFPAVVRAHLLLGGTAPDACSPHNQGGSSTGCTFYECGTNCGSIDCVNDPDHYFGTREAFCPVGSQGASDCGCASNQYCITNASYDANHNVSTWGSQCGTP